MITCFIFPGLLASACSNHEADREFRAGTLKPAHFQALPIQ
jgi:hypothetical protein